MSILLAVTGLIILIIFVILHNLKSRQNLVREAYSHLTAQLDRRYDLIPQLLAIVQVHVPEYGAALEKLVDMRLKSAALGEYATEAEIKLEIFQMLLSLVQHKGYTSEKDQEIRENLHHRLELAEKNIRAAYQFHLTCVNGLNSLNKILRLDISEALAIPELTIERDAEDYIQEINNLILVG